MIANKIIAKMQYKEHKLQSAFRNQPKVFYVIEFITPKFGEPYAIGKWTGNNYYNQEKLFTLVEA